MAQISRENHENNNSNVVQKATYFFEQYIQDNINRKFHYSEPSHKHNRPITTEKVKFNRTCSYILLTSRCLTLWPQCLLHCYQRSYGVGNKVGL